MLHEDQILYGVFHVDDFILVDEQNTIGIFINKLQSTYTSTINHAPTKFLGVDIQYMDEGIVLHCKLYVTQALQFFRLLELHPKRDLISNNPLEWADYDKVILDESEKKVYQQFVGKLWLACRIDIAFHAGYLSRINTRPTLLQYHQAKQAFRYWYQ